MKHSDYISRYKLFEEQERLELAKAVEAHRNEFVFFDCSDKDANQKWWGSDDHDDIPIVHGASKYSCGYDDYCVTRVSISKGIRIYGFVADGSGPDDEELITEIATGHLSGIIDFIPETKSVKDVSIYK